MKIRNTRQKQIVATILEKSDRPLTIAEVLTRAKRSLPSLGIATVYREISRLTELGEVQAVSIPGDPLRYETHRHHHHHFKCTGCTNVFELEGCLKEIARLVPKGFHHETHDITLYGLCRTCA